MTAGPTPWPNPFRVVRNLHALARSLLVIETMCIPGRAPALLLRDEGTEVDQSLRHVALYPTEAVVVASQVPLSAASLRRAPDVLWR